MKRSIITKKAIISSVFFALLFTASSFKYKFNSIESIQFTDVKISCSSVPDLNPIYIIRNTNEFNALLIKNDNRKTMCTKAQIDFNKYTLIGSSTTCHGSAAPVITKKVTMDAVAKKLYYEVEIQEQGTSNDVVQVADYWILVPKLEIKTDVISNIKHNYPPSQQ